MFFDKLVDYFLPAAIRHDKAHPRHDEFRVLVSSALIAIPIVAIFPLLMMYMGMAFLGYYLNLSLIIGLLFSIKLLGQFRIPMLSVGIVTYFILYDFISDSGYIYSTHMGAMHMYLLAGIWVDKKWGWILIISNVLIFLYIYFQTLHTGMNTAVGNTLGSPAYALVLHCFISVFLGGFLAFEQNDQEKNRRKIRALQDQRISLLDEAVKQRTEQLNNMRQAMAADFHDETGNMLSAITRQASLLKLKLQEQHIVMPMVDSIIKNSNDLYARSKDFLWNLNHNSDEPLELFHYLTAHGQQFYNQFDIAFSSTVKAELQQPYQLDGFAALNLVFIFKEAMNNVVKHADASEVFIEMSYRDAQIIYVLQDNGHWKQQDETRPHYGLNNIERRCLKNNFGYSLSKQKDGTRLEITVPVHVPIND